MKQSTLSSLKDGATFKIQNRSDAVRYKRITKEKDGVVFTSLHSERSYKRPGKMKVYVV